MYSINDQKKLLKKGKSKHGLVSISLFILSLTFASSVFFFFMGPRATKAINPLEFLLSPFGGKVKSWELISKDLNCLNITQSIALATGGTVVVTFSELEVGDPKPAKVGIIRINGIGLPGLPTVYDYEKHTNKNNYVLGDSLNICDACSKEELLKDPTIGKICRVKFLNKITDKVCKAAGAGCSPLANVLFRVGSGNKPALW